jgi:AraC family transcriptional regulator
LAKIAVEVERALAQRQLHGDPGRANARLLARGDGWIAQDVVCTSGPQDRPFEEQHSSVSIAIVVSGTFQYRSAAGCELMSPGSLLLGNASQCFECGHEHGSGDRCIAFHYSTGYFERLAVDVAAPRAEQKFSVPRLPALPALSSLVARACTALLTSADGVWEELCLELAARTLQLVNSSSPRSNTATPSALARVTPIVRLIEQRANGELSLETLAQQAGLSPYHFLRTFTQLTGLTPHQYILRTRLREAAMRLEDSTAAPPSKILDIALDSGFGDLSNFNRAFRTEFGINPRAYRRTGGNESW